MSSVRTLISAVIASATFASAPAVLAQTAAPETTSPDTADRPVISVCVPAETPTGYDLPKHGAVSDDSLMLNQPALICIEPGNLQNMTPAAQDRLHTVYKTLAADYANPQNVLPTAKRMSAIGKLPEIELNQAGRNTSGAGTGYETMTYLFTLTVSPDKYVSGQMRLFRIPAPNSAKPALAPSLRTQKIPFSSPLLTGSRPVAV